MPRRFVRHDRLGDVAGVDFDGVFGKIAHLCAQVL